MQASSPPQTRPVYDIIGAIDAARWSGKQKIALALCALAIILDGFDNQILGLAIPGMIKDWGVEKADFAHVLALGFLGMTIGTPIGGILGDRIGRKLTLVFSVMLFGATTLAIAFANGLVDLTIYRALGGIGMGGAIPAATTLIAEMTPARRRSLAVSLGLICIPIGGLLGGMIAKELLPIYGWRSLFLVGGGLPLLVSFILLAVLPESPQFLARKTGNSAEVTRRLRELGCEVPDGCTFAGAAADKKRSSLGALFEGGMPRNTLALWGAFFFCLLPVYVIYAWTPTLLTTSGIEIATASSAIAVFNLGGVLGSLITAYLIGQVGSRTALLSMLTGAVAASVLLSTLDLASVSKTILMAGLFVQGLCILGVQVTLYAVAAYVYPSEVRSTGVGATAGVGRIGALISSYVGAAVTAAGSANFFIAVAACLAVSLVSLSLLRRHIPRSSELEAAPVAAASH